MELTRIIKVCPYCGNDLGHGYRRFGPAQVECYSCRKTVQSGLTPWTDLSGQEKRRLAAAEIIAPSTGPTWAGILLTLTLFYFMPILNAAHLSWMIRESNRYSRTGVPPTWKGYSKLMGWR